jgi:MFS family permease
MAPATPWLSVTALIFAGVIAALQIGKAAIAVPVLQHELGLSLAAASWIIGAHAVLGALGGLPAGVMVSILPMRATVLLGLLACGLGSLAGALASTGSFLLATRVLEGCGFLAVVISVPRLLRAMTAPADREFVFALWGAYLPAGAAVMMIGGPALMSSGWQTLWLFNGALVLAYTLALARMSLGEAVTPAPSADRVKTNLGAVLRAPGALLLALAFGVYTFQYSALAGFLPTLLVEKLGVSITAAGFISALAVACNGLGNVCAGALLRFRVPLWAIMTGAFAFAGTAGFVIFATNLPLIAVAVTAAATLGIVGLIPASIFAAAPSVVPTSALLAIAMGLILQATNLGQLLGPAALGALVGHYGWSRAPLLFAAVMVAGIAIALSLRIVLRRVLSVPT